MTTETTNPVRDLLVRSRRRIEQPEHWTQWRLARDASGKPIEPSDNRAVRFCAIGALDAESLRGAASNIIAWNLLNHAASEIGNLCDFAADINDSCTHADVLAMYDRAIALAEAAS